MEKFINFLSEIDIACDVAGMYENYREDKSVTDTVQHLKYEFEDALHDVDDAPIFWMSLANSMAEQKELSEKIYSKATKILDDESWYEHYSGIALFSEKEREEVKDYLKRGIGKAKRRKPLQKYVTNWKYGDFYAMPFSSSEAEALGLSGRYMIFQMVEATEFNKDVCPAVYISITPDEKLPVAREMLKKCIRVPTRTIIQPYCYRFLAIGRKGFYSEEFKNLIYLGHFEDITPPEETVPRDPIFYTLFSWEDAEDKILLRIRVTNTQI